MEGRNHQNKVNKNPTHQPQIGTFVIKLQRRKIPFLFSSEGHLLNNIMVEAEKQIENWGHVETQETTQAYT